MRGVSVEDCPALTKVSRRWLLSIFTSHLNKNTLWEGEMWQIRAALRSKVCERKNTARDPHGVWSEEKVLLFLSSPEARATLFFLHWWCRAASQPDNLPSILSWKSENGRINDLRALESIIGPIGAHDQSSHPSRLWMNLTIFPC